MTTSPDRVDLAARLAAVRPVPQPPKLARGTRDFKPEQMPCFGGSEVR